jgi:hypothetical protein
VLAGGRQDPQRRPHAVVTARAAELGGLERRDRGSDTVGIERVGLARSLVGTCVHPSGLDNLVSGLASRGCLPGAVGGDAFDDPQGGQIAVGAARSPGDGPIHTGSGGGKLLSGNQLAAAKMA